MAISENASGTQTAVISTEHVLATIATAGAFQLLVDVNAMVDGDELELRIDMKVLTGSTARTVFFATYAHEQGVDANVVISPPIPSVYSIAFTLKQTAGTGRAYDWAIYEYGNA